MAIDAVAEASEIAAPGVQKSTAYALWGDRVAAGRGISSGGQDDAVFATLRIPRLLQYPVTRAETRRVNLVVREYRTPADHKAVLWRFAGIEET
jgi:hypothetical protein